jgi:hypothetical protein
MIRQCAWCRRELGEVAPLEDRSVTHGLCAECRTRLLKSRGETGRGLTAELPAAVLAALESSQRKGRI